MGECLQDSVNRSEKQAILVVLVYGSVGERKVYDGMYVIDRLYGRGLPGVNTGCLLFV